MFKWTHFHKQDRRSYTLITPCKRSAARGVETWHAASLLRNYVVVQPTIGVEWMGVSLPPRAALCLHGVINVIRLAAYSTITFHL